MSSLTVSLSELRLFLFQPSLNRTRTHYGSQYESLSTAKMLLFPVELPVCVDNDNDLSELYRINSFGL